MRRDALAAFGIGLASFLLMALFAATEFTWVFRSGDASDFLAASTWWYVGHVEGFPTYMLLGHALNLLPGAMPMKLALLLAVLPSAATVSLVYWWLRQNGVARDLCIIASLSVIASSIVWTQSLLQMQYTLTMFLGFLGFYLWSRGHRYWAATPLALAIGVHFLGLFFAGTCVLWDWWRSRREEFLPWSTDRWSWVRPAALTLGLTLALYSMIPILMLWPGIPRWIAGPLVLWDPSTWRNLYDYLFEAQGFVGGLPVVQLPERTWHLFGILLVAWGPLWIPTVYGAVRMWRSSSLALILLPLAPIVMWWTFLDTATWTWMVVSFPLLALLLVAGLQALPRWHTHVAGGMVALLLVVNMVTLPVGAIARADGRATTFLSELEALPQDSIVMVMESDLSTTLAYHLASTPGRRLVPFISPKYERYAWHRAWVEGEYGLRSVSERSIGVALGRSRGEKTDVAPMLREVLEDGRPLYLMGYPGITNVLEACFWDKKGDYTYRIKRCE